MKREMREKERRKEKERETSDYAGASYIVNMAHSRERGALVP